MSHTRDVDDAAFVASLDLVKQQLGQQEVANVVDSNLFLKALLSLLSFRQSHDSSIVHQNVKLVVLSVKLISESFD